MTMGGKPPEQGGSTRYSTAHHVPHMRVTQGVPSSLLPPSAAGAPVMCFMGWLTCSGGSLRQGGWHRPPCPTNYIIKKVAIGMR